MFGFGGGAAGDGGAGDGFRPLDVAGWGARFDDLASNAGSDLVAVEVVASPTEAGAPPARRLREIRYDAADEVIEVLAGERAAGDRLVVRHLIFDPRAIAMRDTARSTEIAVLDASGVWTRILVLHPIVANVHERVRRNRGCVAASAGPSPAIDRPRSRRCAPPARCRQIGRLRAIGWAGTGCCG